MKDLIFLPLQSMYTSGLRQYAIRGLGHDVEVRVQDERDEKNRHEVRVLTLPDYARAGMLRFGHEWDDDGVMHLEWSKVVLFLQDLDKVLTECPEEVRSAAALTCFDKDPRLRKTWFREAALGRKRDQGLDWRDQWMLARRLGKFDLTPTDDLIEHAQKELEVGRTSVESLLRCLPYWALDVLVDEWGWRQYVGEDVVEGICKLLEEGGYELPIWEDLERGPRVAEHSGSFSGSST